MEQRRFGRYRATGTLGAGAMGEVYLAVDDVLGREVAIKTLRAGATGLAARLLDERFRQEARAIAALVHPSVVQVYDLDPAADPPYLVLERVAGPSLRAQLASGPLTVEAALALGIQIANALAAAHAAGIVHRDVKPANILGAGPGAWKLADFGVAHVPDSSLTITGQFVGSPAYAAPEALIRGVSSPAGDVYALGATLYQALAGSWPRLDATSGGLLAPPPPLRDAAPWVPLAVATAIERAIAVEPDQRPTAPELAALLATPGDSVPVAAAASVPVAAAAPVPATAGARWPRAVGAALVALLVIGLIASRGGAPGAAPAAGPTAPTAPIAAPADDRPGELRVTPPPRALTDEAAGRAWRELVDRLEDQKLDDARHRLDRWDDTYGPTPETADLRRQLDALPADRGPPGPRKKPHGKKPHRDD